MRARDGCMISACVLSLLFSLLTLIAGCKKGVLNHVSIATYSYDGNLSYINEAENSSYINSTDPLIQALRSPTYPDEFHEWYFEVHYLSLCAGFMGGTEDAYYYQLNCSYRPGSFIFRTDDPFIVDYQAIGGEYPVEAGGPFESFDLRPPFACLVLGIVFSILSLGVVLCDICGWGRWSDLSLVSVGVSMFASIFLMISSALVTSIVMQSGDDNMEYGAWTTSFLGFTWTAVGFMYCVFVWKAIDVVVKKEKRRRLLRTGQI